MFVTPMKIVILTIAITTVYCFGRAGEVGDNSIIINNYIRDVSNSSGGTGQFDNGINVYRRLASGWRTTTYTIAPIRLSE